MITNGIRSTLFNAHVKMATTESIVTESEENTTPELVKENATMEVLTDEDLEKTAQDFAEYLVVNNQQEVIIIYIYIYILCIMNECLYESAEI